MLRDPEARLIGCIHHRGLLIQALAVLFAVLWAQSSAMAESRPSAPVQSRAGAVITQIAVRTVENETSLVIDSSEIVRPYIAAMNGPARLLLDFAGTRFIAPPVTAQDRNGLIKELRFGAFMLGQGRIVVELQAPAHVESMRRLPLQGGGHRLVISLKSVSREAFETLSRPMADDILTGTTRARAQSALPAKPIIILDPGHGGIDSGASGPGGELEKNLVLSVAHLLRERLERGGRVQVMMTRTGDSFVPLRDRVRIARQAKASLFVSLHADALADESGVRGASIYVLSERATDERAARLAERENRADLVAGIDLKDEQDEVADILFDLARRESRAFSNVFARELVQTIPRVTPLHKTPLRGAGFRVLRAPDVPSVLVELGYLTTAEEARMMMTEDWQRNVSAAMADAIERFVTERVQSGRDPAP